MPWQRKLLRWHRSDWRAAREQLGAILGEDRVVKEAACGVLDNRESVKSFKNRGKLTTPPAYLDFRSVGVVECKLVTIVINWHFLYPPEL
jgi:hypothetical protein